MCAQARGAYIQLLETIASSDHPHVVKTWNHVPDINRGEGDAEQYRQFCLGRAQAFDQVQAGGQHPAATAVGTAHGQPLQILLLASRNNATPIENPRQISAYRYPRDYGPRAPSFSRACVTADSELFVSGTAAIVGHRSKHHGCFDSQLRETLDNWRSLLAHTTGKLANQPPVSLTDVSLFRVYLRHARHQARALELLTAEGIDPARLIFLRADICRSELLIEVDGFARLRPAHLPASLTSACETAA